MSVIEHWECDYCGKPATENGHEHLTTDGYRTMPATLKRYVPADQLQGAVDMIRALRDELGAPAADHGGRVMSAWRLADDWLTANGGQS